MGCDRMVGVASTKERSALLATIPLFSGLSRRKLSTIAAASRVRQVERYTKLVSQGDTGDTCFLLLDGTAEVRHDGQLVVELARGSVFGELALLDGGERLADVIMTSTGEVLEVRKAGFDALMRESPDAVRTVMAQLASRLRESELRRFA